MSGRDAPDWLTSIQRPAFAAPGSPFTVASGSGKTLDVQLDTTIHTIALLLTAVSGTVTVSITGDVTGYEYLPPTTTTSDAIFRIAVASQFDTSVTVAVTAAAGASCTVYVGMASDPESLSIANTVTTAGSVTVTNTVNIQGAVEATFPSAQQVEFATPQQVTATFPSAQQVEFAAPQEVTFPAAQQVTVNEIGGVTDVNINNNTLSTNQVVAIPTDYEGISLAAGATWYPTYSCPLGYYDEIWVEIHTTGGYNMTVAGGHGGLTGQVGIAEPNWGAFTQVATGSGYDAIWKFTFPPSLMNFVNLWITNSSGLAMNNAGLYLNVWLVRSSVGSSTNPVQTQAIYQQTTDTGAWNIPSTSLPVGSQTGLTYLTTWLSAAAVKRAQVFLSQSSSSGLGNNGSLVCQLYASPDAKTAYYVTDMAQSTTNGANNWAFDTGMYPEIASGYPYVALGVRIKNQGSATNTVASAGSSTTYIQQ